MSRVKQQLGLQMEILADMIVEESERERYGQQCDCIEQFGDPQVVFVEDLECEWNHHANMEHVMYCSENFTDVRFPTVLYKEDMTQVFI